MLELNCRSEGPKRAGEVGQQEPQGVQEGQMQNLVPATEETLATIRAGGWLGSSSTEKGLKVLVGTKRT